MKIMKRILVVDDDPANILILKTVLHDEGYLISEASNGQEALNLHAAAPFDMIITDWMMPIMDGLLLTSTVRLRRLGNPIIILVTSLTLEGAKERAIMCGADIYLPKPLIPNIIRKTVSDGFKRQETGLVSLKMPQIDVLRTPVGYSAIGIVASTGGPAVLVEFFKNITLDTKTTFFVVQHGPAWMIETFAKSLSILSQKEIILPVNLESVVPGKIYLAPGDSHMTVDAGNMHIRLQDTPPENFVKPSADPLFTTLASAFGIKTIGVVLTGMGCDGVAGAVKIKAAGGMVIVQDPDEAIVPSMPLSVLDTQMGIKSCKIKEMNQQIKNRLQEVSQIT
jgi:two-component system chemotaxis response regulator CheB